MTALMLTTTAAQQREARRRSRLWRSAHTLRYGWPLAALCVGMPIWFFLGVAAFVWSIPGLIWGLAMLAHPERWKVPHGGAFLAGAVVWIALSGVMMVVPKRPSSRIVPTTPPMLTKSPTLKGRRISMKAPAAKLPSNPLQAAPIATPAPASIAANEVVWMPK